MYFSTKIHVLSDALILVAFVNSIAEGFSGGIRFLLKRTPVLLPDMLNDVFAHTTTVAAVFRILFAIIIFTYTKHRLNHYRSLVDEDDFKAMGELQQEFLKDNKSTLSLTAIEQLVRVWAVILIGVEFIYDITSEGYSRFIEQLSGLINYNDITSVEIFVSLYNNTHGFKYIGMMVAILLGVVVTGIFLSDIYIVASALVSTVIFLAAFFTLQMQTIVVFDKVIGVVWTSVVFHCMQTVGILFFSVYIRSKYRGL